MLHLYTKKNQILILEKKNSSYKVLNCNFKGHFIHKGRHVFGFKLFVRGFISYKLIFNHTLSFPFLNKFFSTKKEIHSEYFSQKIIMEYHNNLICKQDIINKNKIIFLDNQFNFKSINLLNDFDIQKYLFLSNYITIKFINIVDKSFRFRLKDFSFIKKHLLYKKIYLLLKFFKKCSSVIKNEHIKLFFESCLELLYEYYQGVDDILIVKSITEEKFFFNKTGLRDQLVANPPYWTTRCKFLPLIKMYKIDPKIGFQILPDTEDVTSENVQSLVKEENVQSLVKEDTVKLETLAEKIENIPLTEQKMQDLEEAFSSKIGTKDVEFYPIIIPKHLENKRWSKNSSNYESTFNFLFFMYRYQGARLCRLLDLEGEQMEPIIFSSKRNGKLMYPREFIYDIEKKKRIRNAFFFESQLEKFSQTPVFSLLSPLCLREYLLYKKYKKNVPINTLINFRTLNRNLETNFTKLDIYDALYLRHTLSYDMFFIEIFVNFVENCIKVELSLLYSKYRRCKVNKFKTESITNVQVDRMFLLIEIVFLSSSIRSGYLIENLLVTRNKLDDFIMSNICKLKINNFILEHGFYDYNFFKLEFLQLKPENIYSNYSKLLTVSNMNEEHQNVKFSITTQELYEITRCLRTQTFPTGVHHLPDRIWLEQFMEKIYGYPFTPITLKEDNIDPMAYKREFLDNDSRIGSVSSFKPF
jgi:hypothetical protein